MIIDINNGIKQYGLVSIYYCDWGWVCGCFINTLAGSGSLVSLAFLIFLGLPATVANETNRVGVLVQGMVSVASCSATGHTGFGQRFETGGASHGWRISWCATRG